MNFENFCNGSFEGWASDWGNLSFPPEKNMRQQKAQREAERPEDSNCKKDGKNLSGVDTKIALFV